MSGLFQFSLSPQANLIRDNIKWIPTQNSNPYFYADSNLKIHSLKYQNSSVLIKELKFPENFEIEIPQQIYSTNILPGNKNLLIFKDSEGLNFYQEDGQNFELLDKNGIFHDVYGWNTPGNVIKFGSFFKDKNIIGILSYHQQDGLSFHGVIIDELLKGEDPVWPLEINLDFINENYNLEASLIYVADVQNSGQDNLVFRDNKGLNIFQFDEENDLKLALTVPYISKELNSENNDKFWFVNISKGLYKDILYINSSGLYLYSYDNHLAIYEQVNFSPGFSKMRGFTKEHIDSFQIVNINGFDYIFFTGPKGIELIHFDMNSNNWIPKLSSLNLGIQNKYRYALGYLKDSFDKSSVVLTQDKTGVYFGKLIEKKFDFPDFYSDSEDDFENEENLDENEIASNSTTKVIPPIGNLLFESEFVFLREQIGIENFVDSVDKFTGKPKFELPLLFTSNSLLNSQLEFNYNGNSKQPGLLGVGWSFPQNFIYVENQGTIFPQDDAYFIVFQNIPVQLFYNENESTSDKWVFKLNNFEEKDSKVEFKNFRFFYYKNLEEWHVLGDGVTQIYGGGGLNGESNSINWELGWRNWQGRGSSSTGQILIPTFWYLTKIEFNYGKMLEFEYDSVKFQIENSVKFTRGVYLKKIEDENKNQVFLEYSQRDPSEYEQFPDVDKFGNLNAFPIQTLYLSGLSIQTATFIQKIKFNYNLKNGIRFLSLIKQEDDIKPVLNFEYSQENLLNKIIFAEDVSFNYDYLETVDEVSKISQELGTRITVSKDYQVNFAPGRVLVSYLTVNKVVEMKMMDEDLKGEKSIVLDKSFVKDYRVEFGSLYLAVEVHFEISNKKELCLFTSLSEKNGEGATCFEFEKDSSVGFGPSWVAIKEKSKLILLNLNQKDQTWDKISLFNSTRNFIGFSIERNMIVAYDDSNIWIGYKNGEIWIGKILKNIPGKFFACQKIFEKFILNEELKENIEDSFKSMLFEIKANIIFLSTLELGADNKLKSVIDLYVLNKNYGIEKSEKFVIEQDDVLDVEKEMNDPSGTNFVFAYKKVNEKYKVFLKNYSGKVVEDFEKERKRMKKLVIEGVDDYLQKLRTNEKESKDKIESEYRKQLPDVPSSHRGELSQQRRDAIAKVDEEVAKIKKETEDKKQEELNKVDEMIEENKEKFKNSVESSAMNNAFLLDLNKYRVGLESRVAFMGNNTYTFTGESWKTGLIEEESRNSFPLGDSFVLSKINDDSDFKLYKQGRNEKKTGNILINFGINDLSKVIIRYPSYLAFSFGSNLNVIEFTDKGKKIGEIFKFPIQEKPSQYSSYSILVTEVAWGDEVYLVLRSISNIRNNFLVNEMKVEFGTGKNRVTGFEFDQISKMNQNGFVTFNKFNIIPGNSKSEFGWIEMDVGGNSTTTRTYFNGEREKVKTEILEKRNKEEEYAEEEEATREENQRKMTLFDKYGDLEIANFKPFKIEDGFVGYFGFENYENSQIGAENSTTKWEFQEKNIIKNNFALTGQNFLRLLPEEKLKGEFILTKDILLDFLVSAWVKIESQKFEDSQSSVILSATLLLENEPKVVTFYSKMKYRIGPWIYLEIFIDTEEAMEIFRQNKYNLDSDIKIKIQISNLEDPKIDVNNICFFPINTKFTANIYDTATKNKKEILGVNGLIERIFHDKNGEEVVKIDRYGIIENISIYSKLIKENNNLETNKSTIEIQPEFGYWENFSPHSFQTGAISIENSNYWKISPGKLSHFSTTTSNFNLESNENINIKSWGWHLNYNMILNSELQINDIFFLKFSNGKNKLHIFDQIKPIPTNGEFTVIFEKQRIFVWVEGNLYFDHKLNLNMTEHEKLFRLTAKGQVSIRNLMIFSNPRIKVTHFNKLNEKIQEINLENENSGLVTNFIYDIIGRLSITTQPIKLVTRNFESILKYHSDIVTNDDPSSEFSAIQTGILTGNSALLSQNGVYGYYQTVYGDDPLNREIKKGLPGFEFSIWGNLPKIYEYTTENQFIKNNFPADRGYIYKIEQNPGNLNEITVLNSNDQKVAVLLDSPESVDLFSTYEYNEKGKLTQILSPNYHKSIGTFTNFGYQPWNNSEHQEKRKLMETIVEYNEEGQVVLKSSPDTGKTEFLYGDDGFLKFVLGPEPENVIYFEYNENGEVIKTGQMTITAPSKEEFLKINLNTNNSLEYQTFSYASQHPDPILRNRLKRIVTYNQPNEPFLEETLINFEEKIISKRLIGENSVIAVNKKYESGFLKEIEYPADFNGQPLIVKLGYNKLGKLTEIGTEEEADLFASINYTHTGQIAKENYSPNFNSSFTRDYSYNSAGFLTNLKDKFLEEKVFYDIENSYESFSFGDGTITKTKFIANWHTSSYQNEILLNENSFKSFGINSELSKNCFNKLISQGYLDENGRQIKSFYPKLDPKLPILCSEGSNGRFIAETIGNSGFPSKYGHSYDYGKQKELSKAKYFVNDEKLEPLQPKSFLKIPGLNSTQADKIWGILKAHGYLIETEKMESIGKKRGKEGKSFLRENIQEDLKTVSGHFLPIQKIVLYNYIEGGGIIPKNEFLNNVKEWKGRELNSRDISNAEIIWDMLVAKGYFIDPISSAFKKVLGKYSSHVKNIVKILFESFGKALGSAEFDVESYEIDPNGNHQKYYHGFSRYALSYEENTNKIKNLDFRSFSNPNWQNFNFRHDKKGNVIEAGHKNIKNIVYHPVSNKATDVELADGGKISFQYDQMGERVLKRVKNPKGEITKEIHYVRDEMGKILVERELLFPSPDELPDIILTAYIWGPRGLIGFIRRNQLYNVISDHEGSTRLVILNGEVVAAYDYMPYGGAMRVFIKFPDGDISYRYTGKEWDEETGLYNFHARFYDPEIGRFYQIDPKNQYFSPYKYAGNSPVSMIDPDGELAFLIAVIVCAAVGAYLGGAGANGTWNPAKWKWKESSTWLGIIGGGIAGGMLPFSFAGLGAAGFIGLGTVGLGGSYLNAASANKDWNPANWNWTSPVTYNAIFQGFSTATGFRPGITQAKKFYTGLDKLGKAAFVTTGGLAFTGVFVANGYSNNWDIKRPGFWNGIVQAGESALFIPIFGAGLLKSGAKHGKNIFSLGNLKYLKVSAGTALKNTFSKNTFKGFLKSNTWRNLGKDWKAFGGSEFLQSIGKVTVGVGLSAGGAYLLGKQTGFNMTNPETYLNILNGITMGGQVTTMYNQGKTFYQNRKAIKAGEKIFGKGNFGLDENGTPWVKMDNIPPELKNKLKSSINNLADGTSVSFKGSLGAVEFSGTMEKGMIFKDMVNGKNTYGVVLKDVTIGTQGKMTGFGELLFKGTYNKPAKSGNVGNVVTKFKTIDLDGVNNYQVDKIRRVREVDLSDVTPVKKCDSCLIPSKTGFGDNHWKSYISNWKDKNKINSRGRCLGRGARRKRSIEDDNYFGDIHSKQYPKQNPKFKKPEKPENTRNKWMDFAKIIPGYIFDFLPFKWVYSENTSGNEHSILGQQNYFEGEFTNTNTFLTRVDNSTLLLLDLFLRKLTKEKYIGCNIHEPKCFMDSAESELIGLSLVISEEFEILIENLIKKCGLELNDLEYDFYEINKIIKNKLLEGKKKGKIVNLPEILLLHAKNASKNLEGKELFLECLKPLIPKGIGQNQN